MGVGLPPKVALAVATLVTVPASRSAWVTVYTTVQFAELGGARLEIELQVVTVPLLIVNGATRVTLPSFFRVYT